MQRRDAEFSEGGAYGDAHKIKWQTVKFCAMRL